ncbi:MAG: hypothetical protein IT186_15970 [Acidobacteria bacterium]|nr:hypothetical protein [Acidobacteriota bacterium]
MVQETSQLDVVASLGRLIERAEMMLTAADEWLRDPADPSRYNLNPRTHEIEVVYEEEDGGRMVRKTAKLSHLMERLEKNLPITIIKGESRTADPRKLLLDAVATLKPVLELLGKASGQLASDAAVNVFFEGPEWRRITDTLIAAIAPFPGAAEAAAGALAAMNGDAVE